MFKVDILWTIVAITDLPCQVGTYVTLNGICKTVAYTIQLDISYYSSCNHIYIIIYSPQQILILPRKFNWTATELLFKQFYAIDVIDHWHNVDVWL